MPIYTNAKYISDSVISVDINDVPSWVPCDSANTDYANMMVLVAEGQLVIEPVE
jgi:hypothetical protein